MCRFDWRFPVEAVLLVSLLPYAANAIEINIRYDAGFLTEPELRPMEDPNGTRLWTVVNAAAEYYESIFLDDRVFDFDIAWSQRPPGSLATAGGSQTIAFNGAVNWFIDDSDPWTHEEFDLDFQSVRRSVYQDATPAQQSSWFRGDVPGSLEYGLVGNSNGTEADLTDFDLLTVAFHEIAHLISRFGSPDGLDGFWDFDTSLIGGRSVGMATISNDSSHIQNNQSILFPTIGASIRRLPSTADLLGIASNWGWTNVDLPRKEFIGGSSWNTAGNWIGSRVPDAGDDVYIRNRDQLSTITLTGTTRAANLFLGERSWLVTGSNDLFVDPLQGTVMVDGAGTDTTLFVDAGGSLQTGTVLLQNQGTIRLRGGQVTALAGNVMVDESSSIIGHGDVSSFGGDLVTLGNVVAAGDCCDSIFQPHRQV